MMNRYLLPCVVAGIITMTGSAPAADNQSLKPFPTAERGMARFVITLPHKTGEEEDLFKLELIAGREMPTDGVNRMRLGNRIEPRTVAGWGYTYYVVTGSSQATSTMMAPPPGSPMTNRFVQAPSLLVRYNSRLPVVVMAPAGYQVRYRIWHTTEDTTEAVNK